jgi:hypothetical protein
LLTDWFSLTGWVLWSCGSRVKAFLERIGTATTDTVLDVGYLDDESPPPDPAPLPPIDSDVFARTMLTQAKEALSQTAVMLNEEPCGDWSAVTEERVMTLFRELGQQALAQALEMRIASAESELPHRRHTSGDWVRKYRRMMAREGHWPPASQDSARETVGSGVG